MEKKVKEKREPTTEEKELYALIVHNSLVEGRHTTQQEICEKIPSFVLNKDPFAHDKCVRIWTAIKNINYASSLEYIIIYKDFEAWIGNKEETDEYIVNLWWGAISPRMSRYWNLKRKANRHGQGKAFDEDGNPIDELEGMDKVFYTSYQAYDKTQENKKGGQVK